MKIKKWLVTVSMDSLRANHAWQIWQPSCGVVALLGIGRETDIIIQATVQYHRSSLDDYSFLCNKEWVVAKRLQVWLAAARLVLERQECP